MKYLLVVLLLAAIASLEFFHALSGGDTPGAICTAEHGKADAINDMRFQHLHGH